MTKKFNTKSYFTQTTRFAQGDLTRMDVNWLKNVFLMTKIALWNLTIIRVAFKSKRIYS